jgi:formate dehydrogenase major subunit
MARFSFLEWPVLRQLRTSDRTGRGESVVSQKTRETAPRTTTADKVVQSVCPWQKVFVKDDKVVQIEGDPDSPISRGRLCPKGAASEQLVNSPGRVTDVLYRAPRAKDWTKIDRGTAIDMIADRFLEARRNHWEDVDEHGHPLRRTMGIASLGGATIDNEENYLAKKLYTAAGAIQIENQARI